MSELESGGFPALGHPLGKAAEYRAAHILAPNAQGWLAAVKLTLRQAACSRLRHPRCLRVTA